MPIAVSAGAARRMLLAAAVMAAGCDSGSSPTTPPGPAPGDQPTITITSAGVSPKELTVSPGTRVLFINNDSRRHDMGSDPHPDHTDCTEINQVNVLNPGQRKETGNLVQPRTCGFHDHDNPSESSLQGRITIR